MANKHRRENWQLGEANHERGKAWLDQIYKGNLGGGESILLSSYTLALESTSPMHWLVRAITQLYDCLGDLTFYHL